MPNTPIQVPVAGVAASLALPPAGETPQLPVGQIFSASVLAAPPGSPMGAVLLALDQGTTVLIRAAFPLQPGERVAAEAEAGGKGKGQILRLVAQSGRPGDAFEALAPGQVRLARNQPLTAGLQSLLGKARGTILGQILDFKNPGSAPVRLGSLQVNFQLDSGAKSGDRLFIRPQTAGGALGLRVLARGGPRSAPGLAGPAGRMQILGAGPLTRAAPAAGGLPVRGTVLTGTVVRVMPAQAGGAGSPGATGTGATGAVFPPGGPQSPSGAPPNPLNPPQPFPGGQSPPIPGAPGRGAGAAPAAGSASRAGGSARAGADGGRTALLRFGGFDAEVPWPPEAASTFPAGSTVRVFVNRTAPLLDLVLLAPAAQSAGGAYLPAGGAGNSGFGSDLISLAEGLAAANRAVPGGAGQAAEDLMEALNRAVLKEDGLSPGRVREAIQQGGSLPSMDQAAPGGRGGAAPDLRENLQSFLRAVREAGLPEGNALSQLSGQAEQALTSVEFLRTANGLRHILDQGSYSHIPFSFGGEKGTLDVVVRRDGEGRQAGGGEDEQHSVVFLLELQGLGPLRVDAGVRGKHVHARFTTQIEEVGRFIEAELPALRDAMEGQEFLIEGLSWIHARPEGEPLVPTLDPEAPSGEQSFINLRV
ncbi:MAG TPA: hypothetical protein DDZ83_15995 [Nitrospinae bacterium]|nr:hypothetical protein [Nitrospinota bacterium]